jgi:hypothetical protein
MQKYKVNQKFIVSKELKIERRSIKRINAQRPAFSRDSRNHDRDIACSGPSDRSTARNDQPQVRRGRSWDRPSSISQYGKTNDSERCTALERSRHGVIPDQGTAQESAGIVIHTIMGTYVETAAVVISC